jgi:hypothetical protein
VTLNEIESSETKLRALRDLKTSPGWAIIMETLKDDLLSSALQLADNPVMTETEMHFRRGAISAARNFVNVIDLLISGSESDLLLASATSQTQNNFNAPAFKE